MNAEIYSRIKKELGSIISQIDLDKVTEEEKQLALVNTSKIFEKIRLFLVNNADSCKKTVYDSVAFLYAFHGEMQRAIDIFSVNEVHYVNANPKEYAYFKSLINYLKTIDEQLKLTFNKLFEKEGSLEKVISECENVIPFMTAVRSLGSDDVIKRLDANEALSKEKLSKELEINKENVKNKIYGDETAKELDDEISNERKEVEELRKSLSEKEEQLRQIEDTRKDALFTTAAHSLSVEKDDLISKVGIDESKDISNIVIDKDLVRELSSKERLVCTAPKSFLNKISERVRKKRLINSLMFDVEKIDNIKVLKITKKDEFFDKIASGKRPIMEAVINSARRKYELLRSWVGIDAELIYKIKESYEMSRDEKQKRLMTQETKNRENTIKANVDTTSRTVFSIDKDDFKEEKAKEQKTSLPKDEIIRVKPEEPKSFHDRLVKFIEEEDKYEDVYSNSSDYDSKKNEPVAESSAPASKKPFNPPVFIDDYKLPDNKSVTLIENTSYNPEEEPVVPTENEQDGFRLVTDEEIDNILKDTRSKIVSGTIKK